MKGDRVEAALGLQHLYRILTQTGGEIWEIEVDIYACS